MAHANRSWGRTGGEPLKVSSPMWRDTLLETANSTEGSYLAYGKGRSYGDVCLNSSGSVIDMSRLRRVLDFDTQSGKIVVEAGLTIAELMPIVTRFGWFPPVVPGTSFVTIGGAIANDIHGKNHHAHGTFSHHVLRFEILRSFGGYSDFVTCSPTENKDIFNATIGGLGMTGIVTVVQLQLIPGGSSVECEKVFFNNKEEFHAIQKDMDEQFQNTVSWLNMHSSKGEGAFLAGRLKGSGQVSLKKTNLSVPNVFPSWFMNHLTMKVMNSVYSHLQKKSAGKNDVSISQFFFPLDHIRSWNHIYGRKGFYQYQFVIPLEAREVLWEIVGKISKFHPGASLGVLKAFGDKKSIGIMSFARQGWTLAVDFPSNGLDIDRFLEELDQIVLEAGGCVYLAKDARMTPQTVEKMYPNLEEWRKLWDPLCCSDFIRRMKWL